MTRKFKFNQSICWEDPSTQIELTSKIAWRRRQPVTDRVFLLGFETVVACDQARKASFLPTGYVKGQDRRNRQNRINKELLHIWFKMGKDLLWCFVPIANEASLRNILLKPPVLTGLKYAPQNASQLHNYNNLAARFQFARGKFPYERAPGSSLIPDFAPGSSLIPDFVYNYPCESYPMACDQISRHLIVCYFHQFLSHTAPFDNMRTI